MGAIADEVGLARPSLYRYFPAILVRWFEQAMGPLIVESDSIARSDASRSDSLDRWVEHQIDFLLDSSNKVLIRASLDTNDLNDEQRGLIGRRHRELYAGLRAIVADDGAAPDGSDSETLQVRVMLIAELLRGLDQVTSSGVSLDVAMAEVLRAVSSSPG